MPKLPKAINDLIQMAAIYYEDGAPGAAALRLSMAAEKMQEIADKRNAFLGITATNTGGSNV